MTSFSVCKKNSLSQKRCIVDEQLQWNTTRKPWSAFQNPSLETAYSAPQRIQHSDFIPVCKKTSICRKRCIIGVKLLLNTNGKPYKPFLNPLLKTVFSAPQRRCHDDVTFGVQENLIISETVYIRRTTSMKHNQKTIVGLPECVIKNCVQRPLADIAT